MSTSSWTRAAAALAVAFAIHGCGDACIRNSDCGSQLVCQAGACVLPPMEVEAGAGDGGASDAGALPPDSSAPDGATEDGGAPVDAGAAEDAGVGDDGGAMPDSGGSGDAGADPADAG